MDRGVRGAGLAAALALACASGAPPPAAVLAKRVQSYAGEIPCADCAAQKLVVTLFPDGSFRERRSYVGAAGEAERVFYELGRWKRSGDDLELRGSRAPSGRFRFAAPTRLRMLDLGGHEIRSQLNYELALRPEPDPIAGPMPLRGEYRYFADAASVRECATGKIYPIPLEADHLALERAYTATQSEPGSPELVTLEGRFEERQPEPGAAPREHVIVERFERLWPGENCATQELLDARWQAFEIDGQTLPELPPSQALALTISAEQSRVSGSTGCNRLTGGYALRANVLGFEAVATTRRACEPEVMERETRLLAALNATASWRLADGVLELLDASGAVRLRAQR